MWQYTDDPVADADAYFEEQEKRLEELPLCEYCEERIQDDYCYEIDNCILCEDCLNRFFRKNVEDLIE